MATIEQVQGGLSQIPSGQENQQIDLVDQSTKKYQKEKLALLQIQQELFDSLQERARPNAADFFLNLGAGFLAPNPTGSFGASLGNAATAVSGYRADQQKKENDLAKMRLELGAQQLGMTKEDIDLAKKQQLSNSLKQLFTGGGQGISIPGVSSVLIEDLDTQTRQLLAAQAISDPEGAMKKLVDMGVERAKVPDAIKSLQYHISQFPPEMRKKLQNWASRAALVDPEKSAALVERVSKAVRSGDMNYEAAQQFLNENSPPSLSVPSPAASPTAQTPDQSPRGVFAGNPSDIFNSIMSIPDPVIRGEALRAYGAQVGTEGKSIQADQPVAVPQPQPAPQAPVSRPSAVSPYRLPTPEQMARPSPRTLEEVEAARLKATAEQDVKDITDFRKSLSENFKTARERMADANTLVSLTEKSPNIFGYFNKPTVANAVTQLVQGGGTILGLNVRVPELKEALIKLGASQDEINTLRQADFISIRQQLALGQQMKGAVSNFERELVARAVATADDSPNVVRWKSNIQKARALADREIWELYQSNPNLPETRFTALPAYRDIQNKLDSRLQANNKAYGF
jgi:hypothetical protein